MTYPDGVDLAQGLTLGWAIANKTDAVSLAAGNGAGAVVSGDFFLYGWALEETTGAAGARCVIIDGADATGEPVMPVTFKAGESTRDWLGFPGFTIERGLFVVVTAGSVAGQLWVMER